MEQSAEVYEPSRAYLRFGWFALALCLLCASAAWRFPSAIVPSLLMAPAALAGFWLGSRPTVRISGAQFNVGERAIAWREVCEINTAWTRPLIIRVNLTNARHKLVVFPAHREQAARLMYELRRHSYLATFDGVAYRDFWTWSTLSAGMRNGTVLEQPVRMVSLDDEEEIERMFQKLKSAGRLDTRVDDSPAQRG